MSRLGDALVRPSRGALNNARGATAPRAAPLRAAGADVKPFLIHGHRAGPIQEVERRRGRRVCRELLTGFEPDQHDFELGRLVQDCGGGPVRALD